MTNQPHGPDKKQNPIAKQEKNLGELKSGMLSSWALLSPELSCPGRSQAPNAFILGALKSGMLLSWALLSPKFSHPGRS